MEFKLRSPFVMGSGEKIWQPGSGEMPVEIRMDVAEAVLSNEVEDYSKYLMQSNAYKQFVWVYASVNRIAEAVAMTPFGVYKKNGEDLVPEVNHEFERLMMNPSPFMDQFELLNATAMHLDLQGNAYWYLEGDSDAVPEQIEILRPDEIKPHPDAKLFVDYYSLNRNGKKRKIPAENIVHFKRYHPNKRYVGLSAIEAAARTLTLEKSIFAYNNSFFKNNCKLGGVLTTEAVLSPELQKRIERAWRDRFKGEEKAHKTAILQGGLKYQPIGLAPKDVEFMNMSNMNRDQILAIFGVSTANLGIVKDVNKSNAEAMYYTFMRDTIKPKLSRIEQKITSRILKRIPEMEDVVFKFDEIVTATRDQEIKEMAIAGKLGILTINEFRKRYLKLGDVKGGNVLMAALAQKDLQDLIEEATEYEDDNDGSEQ